MIPALSVLAVVVYGVALFMLWRERTYRPLLLLLSGSLAMLGQPLWSRLWSNPLQLHGRMLHVGVFSTLPISILIIGGVLLASPPLLVIYGLRHHWWGRHYATGWVMFMVFIAYYLGLTVLEQRTNVVLFARPQLASGALTVVLLHVMLLAGTSFGLLYAFVATRHYALRIAVLPLLLSGLVTSLLFNGILASPFWVTSFLQQQSRQLANQLPDRLLIASAIISMGLVLWGIHLLAGGLHAGRQQQLRWH